MNLNIVSKEKAKTLASSIRREFQALNKGTAELSHNDVLTILAKAQGFANWNAWNATLIGDKPSAALVALVAPKYPLTNNGEFDFIEPGKTGLPFTGNFTLLEATIENVQAKSKVVGASRAISANDKGVSGSGINVQHWGSDVFDDSFVTQVKNGNLVWLTEGGDEYAGVVVFMPENSGQYDESLPVRAKLIEAYLEYYSENGVDDSAREGLFEKAEAILGIWLTEREAEHLLDKLSESAVA